MKSQPDMNELPMVNKQGTDAEMLNILQSETFKYFMRETDPVTGLIADKTQPGSASSIAAVGLGLSSYITAIERRLIPRNEGINRTQTVLSFLYNSEQSTSPAAAGYKGFFYHFLDMRTGHRACECELSTIDTAILMAGVLSVANYFTGKSKEETEIRRLANALYSRVDWIWALNGGDTFTHGWTPENGFIPYRWDTGYSEAIILYILGLGSPTFPVDPKGYKQWTETFSWKEMYNIQCIYAGPLFIHQMSHVWLDFKGIRDDANRRYGIDYFENSSRATCVQQAYAIDNPRGYAHYGKHGWGFTASDGPGPCTELVDGIEREFYDYTARGVPFGPDDGTISPWAVVASLPFQPDLVLKTVRHAIEKLDLKKHSDYGFDASFNPTFPKKTDNRNGWVSPWQFGLNQGPIVIMIENYQSGLIWDTMKRCPYIAKGLQRAGFTGGWLEKVAESETK